MLEAEEETAGDPMIQPSHAQNNSERRPTTIIVGRDAPSLELLLRLSSGRHVLGQSEHVAVTILSGLDGWRPVVGLREVRHRIHEWVLLLLVLLV